MYDDMAGANGWLGYAYGVRQEIDRLPREPVHGLY